MIVLPGVDPITPPPMRVQAVNALRTMEFGEMCQTVLEVMEAYPPCFSDPKQLHDLANRLSRMADQCEREQTT